MEQVRSFLHSALDLMIGLGACFVHSGKSALISMLTRNVAPTSGDAAVDTWSVLSEFRRASNHLGNTTATLRVYQ